MERSTRKDEALGHSSIAYVCVCVRVGYRGAPCLFHWLAPVTTYQQHAKPPEDAFLTLTRSIFLIPLIFSLALIFDCFTSLVSLSLSLSCFNFSLSPWFCVSSLHKHTHTSHLPLPLSLLLSVVILLYHCNIYSFSPPTCNNKVSGPLCKVLNEILGLQGGW